MDSSVLLKNKTVLNNRVNNGDKFTILVVDDGDLIKNDIQSIPSTSKCCVYLYLNEVSDIIKELTNREVNLAILTYMVRGKDILEIVKEILNLNPNIPCILIDNANSKEKLMEAVNSNCFYKILQKPYCIEDLMKIILDGLELYFLKKTNLEYREEIENKNLIFEELLIRMEYILKNISDGVIVLFPDGKINIVTERAKHLLFDDEDETADDKSIMDTKLNDYIKQKVFFFIHSSAKSDKTEWSINNRIYSIQMTKFFNNKEKLLGFILVFIDITKEKEMDKLKADFVSNVSHELRTPLSSIQGFSEMLIYNDDLSIDKQRDFLKIILKESIRLSDMVNSILNLSKIEADLNKPVLKEYELYPIVSDTVALLENKAAGKFIDIETFCDDSGAKVNTNRGMLKEILINIIDNAIKYTQKYGKIDINIYYDNDNTALSIKDNGPGIPENEKENIFKKFYRINSNSEEKGTGLGLSIVKAVAERLKIDIVLNSKMGSGTEFLLIFK
ncbi:MAG TPA: ATP-binding protein [Spirochaetota bacterium]|nr:ATP-binding protein [Spirochaetota bacterium]HOS32626.1 ATP-binding protein [Spirochaetota bacterium]HOS56035.1 ATP-binding protein [Spirochaetota bacterium]HPK61031.1 ATP-binding protein [Spirochaetota bacterium]HQF78491.1 ATP-binding protein [Spirochaetota bacterium]